MRDYGPTIRNQIARTVMDKIHIGSLKAVEAAGLVAPPMDGCETCGTGISFLLRFIDRVEKRGLVGGVGFVIDSKGCMAEGQASVPESRMIR